MWFLTGGSNFLQCGLPGLTTLPATLGQATAHFLMCPSTVLHWFNPQPPQMGHMRTILYWNQMWFMSESLLLCDLLQYKHTQLNVGDLVQVHGDRESSM